MWWRLSCLAIAILASECACAQDAILSRKLGHCLRGLRLSTAFTARSGEEILSECSTALTTTVLASSASGQT